MHHAETTPDTSAVTKHIVKPGFEDDRERHADHMCITGLLSKGRFTGYCEGRFPEKSHQLHGLCYWRPNHPLEPERPTSLQERLHPDLPLERRATGLGIDIVSSSSFLLAQMDV